MIKDWDKSAYRIEFVIVSTGLTLVSVTVRDLTPQREQENSNIGQPHEDTPGKKAKPNSKHAKKQPCQHLAHLAYESKEALKP